MVKGEGFNVLEERLKPLDPDLNKSYKFLEYEVAEAIKTDVVYKKVSMEI